MDVLVEVVRSALVESRHRGVVVRVGPDGTADWSVGDPSTVVFPRSSNKPFQALGMLRAGLPLDGPLLALATSSHSAETVHLEGVREILRLADLDERALQTPPSYPLDPKEHAAWIRAGGTREPILMDCSGKHAAMLLTCVTNGWSTDDYLAPEHPLQQEITATFAELVGAGPDVVGVDGCGAPLLATSVERLARGIGRIMLGEPGSPERRLVDALVAAPVMLSGTRRIEHALMTALPGVVAKAGAESVYVVGLPGGTAFAMKVEDGGERALPVAMGRALQLAGLDHPVLTDRPTVLGGGHPVGELRPAF